MRVPRIALLPLLAVTLSGCDGGSVPMLPSPSSTPAAFESEEEALAGSTQALRAFLDMSTQILSEGGASPERIHAVAGDALALDEIEGFGSFLAKSWRSNGQVQIVKAKLESWSRHQDSTGAVAQLAACLDYSGVDVVDANGLSVVSVNRENLRGLTVGIAISDEKTHSDGSTLTVASKDSAELSRACP